MKYAYIAPTMPTKNAEITNAISLLVPVRTPAHKAQLEEILRLYLDDGTGWALRPDGSYERSSTQGPSAQATLAAARTITPPASRTVEPIG